jgi:two-component system, OmpR family, sensor histidine kinase KdpD
LKKVYSSLKTSWRQYAAAFITFIIISSLNLLLQKWIGYQAIALVYLLSVVLLALYLNRGPIFFGTVLTAGGWNYFFAPPAFAFNISDTYDNMMLLTYFVVTLTVGQLTTRLRAQRDAEIHAKLLTESERLGRTLLNSVSHELRTPIAAISSAVSGLRSSNTLTLAQQNLAAEIEFASTRLNRVVQSLLSAARLQSGQVRPKLDWCDVRDVVRNALRETEELSTGHPIEMKFSADLPLVKMDSMLMEQALVNLVANASTHTPPRTPIEINASVEKKQMILEISDCGPGLPHDQLERIFDLFHRAPTARPGGTGLGLAIVKGFIEAQGGHVSAANRAGGGAVFTVLMPAADAPDLPEETL